MENFLQIASQYGPLGLIILALFAYVLKKDQDHKSEREEFREAMENQHKEALEVTKNNTTVLTEIATLIKFNKK